ncbi:hypothetical protein [Geobacter sp. AOG2]|uniref:hypothetical protein n=1 Tax=Geobacter sp. AOG2 TaxID=1566347 RepID=UPI001CC805D3|nr:hypothetical protein [Geobacter sp. AOG2]GFE62126.1 hypothetical protein AOG2_27140 [Geobacter sp. AOG2]
MARMFFLLVLFFVIAVPCFAGQGTIRETDSQIIIEYWGGEDDAKTAEARRAELKMQALEEKRNEEERKKQEEARIKHEQQMELAERRAKARGY